MKRGFSYIIIAFCLAVSMTFLMASCGRGGGNSAAAPVYTVRYDGNGSTGGSVPVDSTNYEQNQIVTVSGNTGTLVKSGYSFAGWNTKADGSGTTYAQGTTFTMGPANITLYAKWTANPTYTMTYDGNGNTGGSAPVDSTHYEQGQTVTVLADTGNLIKPGYAFSGWNTKADGSGTTYTQTQTFMMGSSNLVLYAKWTANPTYTVTYNGNDGTGGTVPVDSTNYEQGQTVAVLLNTGNLSKSNYAFAGWNTKPDGSGTTYGQGDTFTIGSANVILYAKWNPTYTVTYDDNDKTGGSVPVDPNGYQQGQTVTVLGNTGSLTKSGFTFAGWNTQADGSVTTYAQGAAFTIGSANVTLYAKWTANPTYMVTYDGNGNTGGSAPVDSTHYEQGQTVTVLANAGGLVKSGCTFAGWNTQANGSGTTYSQTQTFTIESSNLVLYAKWTANPTYTVTYNSGNTGGTVPVDLTNYEQGQTATVLGNTGNLVKTNYAFAGWNTKADGSGTSYAQGQTFLMESANVTLYAVWTSTLLSIAPLYPNNGANWNDYVKNDGSRVFTASDTACTGTETGGHSACLHGGELRVVVATGKTSCAGLTASDSLEAFNWFCNDSTGTARFISIGLKDGKLLSDLLDFSAQAWKPNAVTVYDNGTAWNATPSGVWWSNPVVSAGDGSAALSTAGTIYVVRDAINLVSAFTVTSSKVGLVVQPGAIIKGPGLGSGSSVISADGTSTAADFLWMEGDVNASGDDSGVSLKQVRFSRIENLKAENANKCGVFLDTSANNVLNRITGVNNYYGVYLYTSSNNVLSGVTANENVFGLSLDTSSNNTLSGITTNNNAAGIALFLSLNNVLAGVTIANNSNFGVEIGYSTNTMMIGVTAANNPSGVVIYSADNNTLSGIAVAAAVATLRHDVQITYSSNNKFTGPLKVGNNWNYDCSVLGGTNPGLNSDCTNTGSSDATLTKSVSLASSFVGKVTMDDGTNASDSSGAATYPVNPVSFDWLHFDNPYRVWGIDGSAFPNGDQQGPWTSGTGRIWDWTVGAGDTVIKDALALPTGNDTLTQVWSGAAATQADCNTLRPGSVFVTDHCETTFLRNAVEISGDGIGNDDLLCESGETCLYTPNIASYQGEGKLVSAGTFTNGTITGVTLLKYEINGH